MNGNGQVVVAGLFLIASMAVAMVAVGMFEGPTFESEAKPIELLDVDTDEALFSPAPIELLEVKTDEALFGPASMELLEVTTDNALFSPVPMELLEVRTDAASFSPASIELLLEYTDGTEQGAPSEQIYNGVSAQALSQDKAVNMTQIKSHSGACSSPY